MLCLGNLVRDILVAPVSEPRFGRTVWVDSIEDSFGGNGANTSYALAKLGTPVRLAGYVGADHAGDEIIAALTSAGVDTSLLRRSALPTPATVALVNAGGARALLHRPGASREAFREPVEFTSDLVAGCTRFHLANIYALPALRPHAGPLVERAKAAGLTVSIDTGWDSRGEWMATLGPCLPHAGLLFVNEDEARELTGYQDPTEAARSLRQHGAANIVVKLGAAGCLLLYGDRTTIVPGFPVNAADTTGAGDCFAGGFLAALQRGFAYGEAARFANAVGALSVQQLGSTKGLLSFDETLAWMKSF